MYRLVFFSKIKTTSSLSVDMDSTYANLTVPYFQEGYVHYVVDAVFTLVNAIQKLIEEKCFNSPNNKPLCKEFFPFNGTKLLSIIRNITFRNGMMKNFSFEIFIMIFYLELSKRIIKFTTDGDGIGAYDIFQYQIIKPGDELDYIPIGEFTGSDQSTER